MSGITGLGTTYDLPNYTGILHQLTPAATPLFSAIGGLNGGGQTTGVEFEWETFDLRPAGQNVALEGATAPTGVGRVRANVSNITQIHHSKVAVSYSKLGAFGQKSGVNNDQSNPVRSELNWQVEQELKSMVLDVEWSFINGVYNKPADNSGTRRTRGLIQAITSNVINNGTAHDGLSAATTVITETATTLKNGDALRFTDVGASTAINTMDVYYVVAQATNAISVATSPGGTAISIGTATVSFNALSSTALSTDDVDGLAQTVYDAGGIQDGSTATLIGSSTQKRAISKAYADAYGKFQETSRTVGGVNVSTIVTNFGVLNFMLSRHVPKDTLVLASLEALRPVYLETPGKGHFFAEPLAKTGSSDDVQLYGEIGLAYGPETAHGVLRGLAV